ncbi:A disintegrin and metalloproteinase with thrombospondin motifs adt-2-like [Diaphorina citri]|uniref:A disintegrin and metalloproteinase with thrombospondin motifs adt-2-like n=1 Tax=Diaphorina citri TaxID=121845 RepID=A0A1S3D0T9_DIACI|nr:A disintegrin and metalloproteinase with thrombospondin motifs adt-2-like [Diaphorina citri]
MEDAWSEWGPWSLCSVECGGGTQYRTRTCEGRPDDCAGQQKMSRPCNLHSCKGEWSCWTEWSQCSVTCGKGFRQRTRHCLAVNNRQVEGTGCEGPFVSQEPCEMPPCQLKY